MRVSFKFGQFDFGTLVAILVFFITLPISCLVLILFMMSCTIGLSNLGARLFESWLGFIWGWIEG